MFHVEHDANSMDEILSPVRAYCAENGLSFSGELGEKLLIYTNFLREYNQTVNLTAITEPREIAVKHFIDSLSLFTAVSPNGRFLHVGSGAGFPGVVIKLMRPSLDMVLMDSVGKKTKFLIQLAGALETEVSVLCGRAEELARDRALRETFDFVSARAVAALPALCEYCLPFVKKGGFFIAMKGPSYKEELALSGNAVSLLGGKVKAAIERKLPDQSVRGLILIEKISQTSSLYPRNAAQISKKPL